MKHINFQPAHTICQYLQHANLLAHHITNITNNITNHNVTITPINLTITITCITLLTHATRNRKNVVPGR